VAVWKPEAKHRTSQVALGPTRLL